MAIDDLLDEHEQSERVRSWLRNNGASLIGGICVGLAAIIGWHWWQKQHTASAVEAHSRYQAVLASINAKKLDQASKDMAALASSKREIYVDLATLQLAKAQVEAGKSDDAMKTLRGVSAKGEFKNIVDQRLAVLLLDQGKADEALKQLGDAQDEASLELRGDALKALGKRDEAREAYSKALVNLDVAAPQRRLLETKLVDVGGTIPEQPSETI